MHKIITTTAAALAAALTLTACSATEATAPERPTITTVTTTAAAPTPTGTLRQQFQNNGLTTVGLDNETIRTAGESMCEARDAGASHAMIMGVADDSLGDFYSPDELETIATIWYANLCPQHA